MDILLVCTGNTCRSSMAEGIFNQILKENDDDDVHVTSAGISVYVSTSASEEAICAMEEMDIDISDHMSSQITEEGRQPSFQCIQALSTTASIGWRTYRAAPTVPNRKVCIRL